MKYFYLFSVATLLALTPTTVISEPPIFVGELHEFGVKGGCSCWLGFPGTPRNEIFSSEHNGTRGRMNLYGKDVEFQLTENTKGKLEEGVPYTRRYKAGEHELSIEFTPEFCEPGQFCDGYGVTATITIINEDHIETFLAEGGCGC